MIWRFYSSEFSFDIDKHGERSINVSPKWHYPSYDVVTPNPEFEFGDFQSLTEREANIRLVIGGPELVVSEAKYAFVDPNAIDETIDLLPRKPRSCFTFYSDDECDRISVTAAIETEQYEKLEDAFKSHAYAGSPKWITLTFATSRMILVDGFDSAQEISEHDKVGFLFDNPSVSFQFGKEMPEAPDALKLRSMALR